MLAVGLRLVWYQNAQSSRVVKGIGVGLLKIGTGQDRARAREVMQVNSATFPPMRWRRTQSTILAFQKGGNQLNLFQTSFISQIETRISHQARRFSATEFMWKGQGRQLGGIRKFDSGVSMENKVKTNDHRPGHFLRSSYLSSLLFSSSLFFFLFTRVDASNIIPKRSKVERRASLCAYVANVRGFLWIGRGYDDALNIMAACIDEKSDSDRVKDREAIWRID